jgi:hypothetical protein
MHATCPAQSKFQWSIPSNRRVRRYGGRASVTRRTQSSKLPNRAKPHQTRPSLEHHRVHCLLQQRVNEGKPTDADISVRHSRDQHLSHREQCAPPRAKHQTRQLCLTPTKPTSVAQKTTTITSVTLPSVPSFDAMENKRFISTKKRLNPTELARREGERTPNLSLPLKLHRLRKCANTTKCTSPCACVLAFSQWFFKALC